MNLRYVQYIIDNLTPHERTAFNLYGTIEPFAKKFCRSCGGDGVVPADDNNLVECDDCLGCGFEEQPANPWSCLPDECDDEE